MNKKDQNRINFPEMTKVIDKFKRQYEGIKVEFVKENGNTLGRKFEGVEINPTISDKVKLK